MRFLVIFLPLSILGADRAISPGLSPPAQLGSEKA